MAFYRCVPKIRQNGDVLPIGYTRVEYLESNGNQIIRTPLVFQTDIFSQIDIIFTANQDSYTFSGRCSNTGYQRSAFGCYRSFMQTNNGVSYFLTKSIEYGERKILTSDDRTSTEGKWYLSISDGGTSVIDAPEIDNSEGTHFTLFARGKGDIDGAYDEFTHCKIFSLFCKKGDDVLMNLIPCIDRDRTPCMFDTVTKTASYNLTNRQLGYGTFDGTYVAPI